MKTLRNAVIPVSMALTLLLVVLLVGPSAFKNGVDTAYDNAAKNMSGGVESSIGGDKQYLSGDVSADFSKPQNGEQIFPQDNNTEPIKKTGDYIIREASLSVQVKEIESKMDEVRKVIKDNGGDVTYSTSRVKDRESTSAVGDNDGRYPYYPIQGDYAVFNINVPVDSLDTLLEGLRGVGKVVSDSVSANNVTLEVTGLDAKIESGAKSLERLEALLSDAQNIDEVLRVEQALEQRRAELDSWKAQSEALKNRADASTVTVSLVTEQSVKTITGETGWFEKTWNKISSGLSGSVAIVVVLLSIVIPFVLVWWLIAAIVRRMKTKKVSLPATSSHIDSNEKLSDAVGIDKDDVDVKE